MAKLDKAFLVIGAGILQIPMILQAQKTGLFCYATDGAWDAPGAKIADKFVCIDTYNIDQHKQLVAMIGKGGPPLVGVATCGADVAPTVAACAETGNLPGIPYDVAKVTHNKLDVRQALDRSGLSKYQPKWAWLTTKGNAWKDVGVEAIKGWDSVVLKPLEQRASRGVSAVSNMAEFEMGFQYAKSYQDLDPDHDYILIEEQMMGTEHSAEIILTDGQTPVFFNIVDRLFNYEGGYAIEMGHVNPTCISEQMYKKVFIMVMGAAQALGVRWGPFKCDVMITTDGPKILECTARLSGGFDCQATSPALGKHPIQKVIQLACGVQSDRFLDLSLNYVQGKGPYAACAAAFAPDGYIVQTPREDAIRAMPGVIDVVTTSKVGERIDGYIHCAQRPGFVIATGKTYNNAWDAASRAASAMGQEFRME